VHSTRDSNPQSSARNHNPDRAEIGGGRLTIRPMELQANYIIEMKYDNHRVVVRVSHDDYCYSVGHFRKLRAGLVGLSEGK
jgi:hypothetical protein